MTDLLNGKPVSKWFMLEELRVCYLLVSFFTNTYYHVWIEHVVKFQKRDFSSSFTWKRPCKIERSRIFWEPLLNVSSYCILNWVIGNLMNSGLCLLCNFPCVSERVELCCYLPRRKKQHKRIGLMDMLWIYTGIVKAEMSPVDVEVSR